MVRPARLRLTAALLAVVIAAAACSASTKAGHPREHGRRTSANSATAPPLPAVSALSQRSPSPSPSPTASTRHVARTAVRLPLRLPTGAATQVITVTARSESSTTATLLTWRHATTGWQRVGPSVPAFLGSGGLSTHPSEAQSATPIGSFTLTQAFGHDADPGDALPYTQTTPADWWISQPGPLYNTRQRCAARCPFTQGAPNEHLYYELPYYRYAVVIDYNTRNAPGGVRQGAGSAFFLHVTVGRPTQGCISIAQAQLVRILRWLTPSTHPRILIGVG